jgi:formamidase
MPETKITVDLERPPDDQPVPVHNRWHPDVPSVVSVDPGESLRVECLDWTGGQIDDTDSANDVRDVDLDQVHYLSGPIEVEGASPGDLLVMEILDIGVLNERSEWGFTGIFDQRNGGGFLTDHFPEAGKTIWDLHGTKASSRHVPDVHFEGKIHPGLVGTAPSQELLEEWNERERALTERDNASVQNHPTKADEPPTANLPTAHSAVMGGLSGDDAERAAEEGARTVPPRENGGNCDIKDLSLGSTVYFPVYVDGGKLSIGDIHHSQGDGEISFCGAIEMAGYVDMRLDVIEDGVDRLGIDHPVFEPGHRGPTFSEYVTFEGYSVTEDGEQHYMDPHVAYRRACLDAIEYLKKFGYTGRQAYMLLSAIPVEGRHSGVVDIPNACSTLAVPKAVFEFDIGPRAIRGAPDSRGHAASTDGRLGEDG